MGLLRLVGPAGALVDMDELKLRLKIDDDTDDTGLVQLLNSATRRAEQKTQRAFLTQKWQLSLDAFPCKNGGEITIPLPPLQSVESIKYIDVNGVEQLIADTDYQVINDELLGSVCPAFGKAWPSAQSSRQAIKIEFTCGYGESASVEPDIILAVMLLVAHYDQNREAVVDRTMTELPMGVDDLLSPYVIPVSP